MATFNSNVFSSTYKDDFADSDNYYRLLFNAGRALQARELTQLQTIIQKEISRFGGNIFKDGAAVSSGQPTLNAKYEFIKLNTTTNTLPSNPDDLIDVTLTGSTSGIEFTVLEVVAAEGSDPATLYGKYVDTTGGTAGATPIRMTPSEDMTGGGFTLTVQTTNTAVNPAVGIGVRISTGKGDFFVLGRFVFVQPQSLILSKYSNTVTDASIGFLVTQDIVTESDNEALYDNTGSSPNVSAPGAHRYRIRLTLIEEADVTADQMFVSLCKVQNTNIVSDANEGTNDYNKIEDRLATRTFEESGNYLVSPFSVRFEDTDSDAFTLVTSPGLGYVNGYRANVSYTTRINTPKPTATYTENNQNIAAVYGNYVLFDSCNGLPDIGTRAKLNIRNGNDYGGSTIGTARIRSIEDAGSSGYRAYLFDIKMNSGQNFRSTKSIGLSANDTINVVRTGGTASIVEPAENNLLFDLPRTRPQSISDISLTVQRYGQVTLNGSGVGTLSLATTGETFTDNTSWVMATDTGTVFDPDVTPTGSGTQSSTITSVANASATIDVLYYVNIAGGAVKTKTLTETTNTTTLKTDGITGEQYIDLYKADIYEVTRIRQDDSDGRDLTSSFTIDNGQRDNYYGNGRLVLKPSAAVSGNVFARFKYFAHGSAGNFFARNSYSDIPYGSIPNFRLANGNTVNLRNVLDFRPTVDSSGDAYTGTNGQVIQIPRNTDAIQCDIDYYMARADILALNEQGYVELIQGTPQITPEFPKVPTTSLPLYQITMGPNTLSNKDVITKQLKYKRYTMADIANLEDRLNKLNEITTLSLLELDTKNLDVLDSAGNNRTKAGFLVDNFKDFFSSATYYSDYRASLDLSRGLLKPSQNTNSISLVYDSAASTNIVKRGDNLYLKYDHSDYITQGLASGFENINPFNVITRKGLLELSPASDNWKSEVLHEPMFTQGSLQLDSSLDPSRIAAEWGLNWSGVDVDELTPGDVLGSRSQFDEVVQTGNFRFETIQTTSELVVTQAESLTRSLGTRVISSVTVPFMRSRKVYFRAFNLMPNTRHYAFFDDVDVSNWVRSETFTRISDDAANLDPGTQHSNATQHPETPSSLISNNDGYVAGSFFIPDTAGLRFKSGTAELKLVNVTTGDKTEATSTAVADYTSSGIIDHLQETFLTTRSLNLDVRQTRDIINTGQLDPLAQTFTVTENEGIFLTKVRVYFRTKDVTGPVICQIRPVTNGHPDSTFIRASKVLNASEITARQTWNTGTLAYDTPAYDETLANVTANGTDFEFDEPIHLQGGGTEYALVLLSDSNKYNVYVATVGEFVVGSTEKAVTQQPTLGSLFISQNGTTWEPSQTQDMMFKLSKATFQTSGSVILENGDIPLARSRKADPIITTANDATIKYNFKNHGLQVDDKIVIRGLDSAASYGGILGSNINGERSVTAVDGFSFQFEAGGGDSADSDGFYGGILSTIERNYKFSQAYPNVQFILPNETSLSATAQFHTAQSFAGTETAYTALPSEALNLNKDNIYPELRLIANPTMEADPTGLSGGKSASITMAVATASTNVSPVIDTQRAALFCTENLIDKQDSASTSGFNVPITFTNETSATAGTSLAKHITIPVTLEEGATGLKVLLAANRPSAADIQLYYRIGQEGVDLNATPYVLKASETTIPADDNPSIFREYEYVIGGDGGNLDEFTQFQLKVVMRSVNQARIPVVRDLRVIALVD